jgi:GNAT superfamily N-acetyltransferase
VSVRTEIVGPDRFDDVATLFGPNGAIAGCWCMWWRKPNKEWSAGTGKTDAGKTDAGRTDAGRRDAGQTNREAFEAAVRSGAPVGLLAYADSGAPVGWIATAPRPAYPRLLRSNTLRLPDQQDPAIWSAPCLFVHRDHRRTGIGTALLGAAVDYARGQGATALEGYPTADGGRRRGSNELFTGTVSMFLDNGFTEHARPPGARLVMRRELAGRGRRR